MKIKKQHIIIILISSLCLLLFSCNRDKTNPKSYNSINPNDYFFESHDSINAGDDLVIYINKWDDKNEYYLIVNNVLGTEVIDIDKYKNENGFKIPSYISQKSGELHLSLYVNHQEAYQKSVYVSPLKAIEFLESYIGPKSILTTTAEPCMLVAMPTDTFNNPMPDGKRIIYNMFRPTLIKQFHKKKIETLISHHTFFATEKTGKTLIGIECDESSSNEKYVDEEPGWAKDISLAPITKTNLKADGTHYLSIKTEIIYDKLNNIVFDGTIVTFVIYNEETQVYNQYTGITVDGVAKINLKHPFKKTSFKIYAICGRVKSDEIQVNFESGIQNYLVYYDDEQQSIEIGPISGYLNQLVPDGSIIHYKITEKNNLDEYKEGTSRTQKGRSSILIEELFLENGKYLIELQISDKTTNFNFEI